MVGQMHDDPVKPSAIAEQDGQPSEEVRQRGGPLVGLESILLVDPHPRQLLPPPRQVVAAPRELLLGLEQLEPGREPLFTCPDSVLRHRSWPPLARRRAPAATSASVP